MGLLDGKVGIVFGSGRGIGAAICRKIVDEGGSTVINYLEKDEPANRLFEELRSSGRTILAKADAREYDSVVKVVDATIDAWGKIDFIVNSTHTPFRRFTSFVELQWNDFEDQLDGTLQCTFNACKAAYPFLKQSKGSILNLSSILVRHAIKGCYHRSIAKSTVDTLTSNLALELAQDGIRVNALSIGWTKTDQLGLFPPEFIKSIAAGIPLKRLAERKEIAEFAVFLLSERSSYMSGEILTIDGGLGAL